MESSYGYCVAYSFELFRTQTESILGIVEVNTGVC